MTVQEYSQVYSVSQICPHVVADSRSKMSKFVSGVSSCVVKECRTAMLIKKMDISRIMVHDQQIEEAKNKEKEREKKRVRTGSFNFAQPKSESRNHSQFHLKSLVPTPSSSSALVPKFMNDYRDRVPGSKSQGSVNIDRTNPLCQK